MVLASLNFESFDQQHSSKMIYHVLDSGPVSLFGDSLRMGRNLEFVLDALLEMCPFIFSHPNGIFIP